MALIHLHCEARREDRDLEPAQDHHEVFLRDVRSDPFFLICWYRNVDDLCCEVVTLISACRIKVMYMHYDERSGLLAPLIADDVYEIIMKVRYILIKISLEVP